MAEQTGWQGERLTIGLLGGGTVGAAVALKTVDAPATGGEPQGKTFQGIYQ